MTVGEKVGQLNLVTAGQIVTGPSGSGDVLANIRAGNVGGVFNIWGRESVAAMQRAAVEESRLGAPLFFGLDVLHGFRTIFPVPLAEAGAFDPYLWEETARAAAEEAAAEGIDLTFAPMLDVCRDPRWGRIVEGAGEDPLVAAKFAQAKIRGFQGSGLSSRVAIAATGKHFCGGGAAQAGRDYAAVDMSDRELHETYLPPFAAAVAAGCAAIMPAFNSLAGIPLTAHGALINGWLREKHGFDGVVISDYTAIVELVQHGVAADEVEAAALALKAGVDMDMVSGCYLRLPEALSRGLVAEADIDAAVRRVLALKEKLGLLVDPTLRLTPARSPHKRWNELALDAARRSVVLLTNRGVLPLAANIRRLAVIGPLADASAEMLGPWSAAGDPAKAVTTLHALRAAWTQGELLHHRGVDIESDDASGIDAARALCATADVVVLCLGESAGMSGEAASRAMPGLPGRQRELAEAVLSAGPPVVLVLSAGRPLMVANLIEQAAAVVASWQLGDRAGDAIADLLLGRINPSGRLAVTWPREIGQIPIHYAQRSTGRPPQSTDPFTSKYLDAPNDPLFPFGHGLSFASVSLKNLRATPAEFDEGAPVRIEIDVSNNGKVATEETIFLFLHDIVASVARPMMELKEWTKVTLQPGETRTVFFLLDGKHFEFLDRTLVPVVEAGDFEVMVGVNADSNSALRTRIRLPAAAISARDRSDRISSIQG
ncbi:glycoside hydrolase family 3 N-terminal domain-containing protein [Methylocystis echinoides]|uniref:beta-glucosidase n=1 Tax=Methylocystis echinoides TaxID=29468 RepID=A0A9W6GTI0_9HYPH|nr:glycoside hydrolase family 3 N-terminal domain-containing protein [Methylocystis echinoides]GLI92581.1 beta-glucosidase [Methylocystis echinoides]